MGKKAIDVKVRSDLYNIIKEYESIVSDYDTAKNNQEILKGEQDG